MFNRTPSNNNIPPFPENGFKIQDQEPEPRITPFGLIRKLVFISGLLLLLLYAILSLSAPFLKIKIQDYLENQLNTNIKIKSIGINLLTRSLTLENVEIKNPKEFGSEIFFKTEKVSIRPAILPLFSKKLVISRIAIENPTINLCKMGKNQNNWTFLFNNSENNQKKYLLPVNPIKDNIGLLKLNSTQSNFLVEVSNGVKEFLIKNGTIKYRQITESKEKSEIELDGIFLYTRIQKYPIEYIKDTPLYMNIKGRGYFPTKPRGTLSFEGNINILEKQPSFLGKIQMKTISLTYFNKFYPDDSEIEILSGFFSLETKTGCLQGRINAKPDVTVKGLQLKLTSNYSTSDIFKLPLMLVINFFDIYKEELKFSFNINGTLKDPQFHLKEILKQEISTMINESIMDAITTTPDIAEKLKSLGNTTVEAGKIVTKPISSIINKTEEN